MLLTISVVRRTFCAFVVVAFAVFAGHISSASAAGPGVGVPQLISTPAAIPYEGAYLPVVSGDGRHVAFVARSRNDLQETDVWQVFVRDRLASAPVLVSVRLSSGLRGQADSGSPSISATGRYIAFASLDSQLVSGPGGFQQIYVLDRDADNDGIFDETTPGSRKMVRVSIRPPGNSFYASANCYAPSISPNGRFVVFHSAANNLVIPDQNGLPPLGADVFVHDRDADGNGVFDETTAGGLTTVRVSVTTAGQQTNLNSMNTFASISANARFVTFESTATNLAANDDNGFPDVFLRDRDTDGNGVLDEPQGVSTTRISRGAGDSNSNGPSGRAMVSADGEYVVFVSGASNLVPGDHDRCGDVFLFDRVAGSLRRISHAASGPVAGGMAPIISADGRFAVFQSVAELVPDDHNGQVDSFMFDRLAPKPAETIRRVSVGPGNAEIQLGGGQSFVAGSGGVIAFSTFSSLTPDDANQKRDVYAIELEGRR